MESEPIESEENCTFPEVSDHKADGFRVVKNANLRFNVIGEGASVVGGAIGIIHGDGSVKLFRVELGGGNKALVDGGTGASTVEHSFDGVGAAGIESGERDVDVHLAAGAADEDWRGKGRDGGSFF